MSVIRTKPGKRALRVAHQVHQPSSILTGGAITAVKFESPKNLNAWK